MCLYFFIDLRVLSALPILLFMFLNLVSLPDYISYVDRILINISFLQSHIYDFIIFISAIVFGFLSIVLFFFRRKKFLLISAFLLFFGLQYFF